MNIRKTFCITFAIFTLLLNGYLLSKERHVYIELHHLDHEIHLEYDQAHNERDYYNDI